MDVLIVDDSAAFRRAVRLLLERRGYEVVAEAGTAAAAEELARKLKPAAMLVDVGLPDGSGFGVAASLTRLCPDLAILLTSVEDYGSCFALADECGARGFVLKPQLAGCDLARFWSLP